MITKSELIVGQYYLGNRKTLARWNGKQFIYLQFKEGCVAVNHAEDYNEYSLGFKPKALVTNPGYKIPLSVCNPG